MNNRIEVQNQAGFPVNTAVLQPRAAAQLVFNGSEIL